METGSRNEKNVIQALPGFHAAHFSKRIVHVAKRGLVRSKDERHSCIATSPDGLVCMQLNGETEAGILEMKTFTGKESLSDAQKARAEHGAIFSIRFRQGQVEESLKTLQAVAPNEGHRCQLIHHASVHDHDLVLRIAASTSKILFVCEVRVPEDVRIALREAVAAIKEEFLRWCDGDTSQLPNFSEEVLGDAGTMECFKSYWSLIHECRRVVNAHGPFPESQHVKPRLLVSWNLHKGGKGVMSRVLKNIGFHSGGMHAKARIILRMLLVQVTNACYAYIMHCVRDWFMDERRQTDSCITWRRRGAEVCSASEFLERLLHLGYGHLACDLPSESKDDSSDDKTSTRVSTTPPAVEKARGSTRRNAMHESGDLLHIRRGSRGEGRHLVLHSRAKVLKPGTVRGSGGWRAYCSSAARAPRKRCRTSSGAAASTTVPDKTGLCKSRTKCETCQVFLCTRKRGANTNTCEYLWHTRRKLP